MLQVKPFKKTFKNKLNYGKTSIILHSFNSHSRKQPLTLEMTVDFPLEVTGNLSFL